VIEGPVQGTGKGLLASAISEIATGSLPRAQALPSDDDETRRTLTASLLAAQQIIFLDNLDSGGRRGLIHRPSLASALTTEVVNDRRIRTSEILKLPNHALWLATGNNPQLSGELARRTVRIRLVPMEERPWLRTGFRHPDLLAWARSERPSLVRALLVLARSWVVAGRPRGERVLGSFEAWSAVIGGILDHVGISGFLGNLDDLYAEVDAEGEPWREFCRAWWDGFGGGDVRVSQLNDLCCEHDLMVSVRGAGSERSQETRLGNALVGARDRVFAGFVIEIVKDRGRKKGRWYALRLAPEGDITTDASRDEKRGDRT
jgi:hypothetical protein